MGIFSEGGGGRIGFLGKVFGKDGGGGKIGTFGSEGGGGRFTMFGKVGGGGRFTIFGKVGGGGKFGSPGRVGGGGKVFGRLSEGGEGKNPPPVLLLLAVFPPKFSLASSMALAFFMLYEFPFISYFWTTTVSYLGEFFLKRLASNSFLASLNPVVDDF